MKITQHYLSNFLQHSPRHTAHKYLTFLIDSACWDLISKVATNRSIYCLARVENASKLCQRWLRLSELVKETQDFVNQGFITIKLGQKINKI